VSDRQASVPFARLKAGKPQVADLLS